MSVYLVGAIDIEDEAEYARYVAEAGASLAGHSVESLAVADNPSLIEGTLPARRIILMRFDSHEEMYAWYRSDRYQSDTLIYRSKNGAFSDSMAVRGDGGMGVGTAWLFRS